MIICKDVATEETKKRRKRENNDDHCANVSTQTEPVHYNKGQHSTRSIERGKCTN